MSNTIIKGSKAKYRGRVIVLSKDLPEHDLYGTFSTLNTNGSIIEIRVKRTDVVFFRILKPPKTVIKDPL